MRSVLLMSTPVELEFGVWVLATSGQGLGVRVGVEPVGWLVKLKAMSPRGGLLGAVSVSVTVAVQVAGLLAGVVAGQSSVVEEERAVTVIVSLPLLAA